MPAAVATSSMSLRSRGPSAGKSPAKRRGGTVSVEEQGEPVDPEICLADSGDAAAPGSSQPEAGTGTARGTAEASVSPLKRKRSSPRQAKNAGRAAAAGRAHGRPAGSRVSPRLLASPQGGGAASGETGVSPRREVSMAQPEGEGTEGHGNADPARAESLRPQAGASAAEAGWISPRGGGAARSGADAQQYVCLSIPSRAPAGNPSVGPNDSSSDIVEVGGGGSPVSSLPAAAAAAAADGRGWQGTGGSGRTAEAVVNLGEGSPVVAISSARRGRKRRGAAGAAAGAQPQAQPEQPGSGAMRSSDIIEILDDEDEDGSDDIVLITASQVAPRQASRRGRGPRHFSAQAATGPQEEDVCEVLFASTGPSQRRRQEMARAVAAEASTGGSRLWRGAIPFFQSAPEVARGAPEFPPSAAARGLTPLSWVTIGLRGASAALGLGMSGQPAGEEHCPPFPPLQARPLPGPSASVLARAAAPAAAAPPASPEAPPSLKLKCPICLDDMREETTTSCGHLFCKPCITLAVQTKKCCPTCRKKLTTKGFHRVYLQ